MSKIIMFTLSVEAEDDGIDGLSSEEQLLATQMLSDMEEIVGKSPFSLNDSTYSVEA